MTLARSNSRANLDVEGLKARWAPVYLVPRAMFLAVLRRTVPRSSGGSVEPVPGRFLEC